MKYLFCLICLCMSLLPTMAQDEEPPAVEIPKTRKVVPRTSTPASQTTPKVNRTAQEDSVVVEPGFLNLVVNTEVDALIRKNRYVKQNQKSVEGWRIQIIQATDKTKVLSMRAQVSNAFPQYQTYLDYKRPYFKLRIGNFTERFQAYSAHKEVSKEFNRAFLVRERIPMEKVRNW